MYVYVVVNTEYSGQPATRYLTGFNGSTSVLIFGLDERLGSNAFTGVKFAYLLLDSRYWSSELHTTPSSKFRVETVRIGRGYTVIMALEEIIKKHAIHEVILDDTITTCFQAEQLKKKGINILFQTGIFEKLREVKDKQEITHIRKAITMAKSAFLTIKDRVQPGVSEMQIAAWLEYEAKLLGSEKMAFETIVASGENSVQPHATTTQKIISDTDSVLIDFGCVYNGFCSDLTYTLLMPRASDELHTIYSVVSQAKKKAKDVAKVGTKASDVDKIAREHIMSHGYGEYFGHAVGHGVGMSVHELPHVHGQSEFILQAGHVITIEPGIYVPGVGGVRIETTEILM